MNDGKTQVTGFQRWEKQMDFQHEPLSEAQSSALMQEYERRAFRVRIRQGVLLIALSMLLYFFLTHFAHFDFDRSADWSTGECMVVWATILLMVGLFFSGVFCILNSLGSQPYSELDALCVDELEYMRDKVCSQNDQLQKAWNAWLAQGATIRRRDLRACQAYLRDLRCAAVGLGRKLTH